MTRKTAFVVVIRGIPKYKVPYTMPHGISTEAGKSDFLLSCNGKTAINRKNAALLNSYYLAEKLLKYWLPRLRNMPWGSDFNSEIKEIEMSPSEYQWAEKCSIEVEELFASKEQFIKPFFCVVVD